jgi:hypothetical protein
VRKIVKMLIERYLRIKIGKDILVVQAYLEVTYGVAIERVLARWSTNLNSRASKSKPPMAS